MTVRVLDTFTAPDGTLLTGRTPETAPAGATWFPVGPAPLPVGDILSNQARIQDIGDGSGRGYLVESDIADAEITMRFTGNSINPTFGGIKFRGTLTDHWVVRQDASTNTAILFRPNGSIADSGTLITGVNDMVDFTVTLRGVTITCLIENVGSGAQITLSTSDTTNETATLHGLHSRTAFGAGVGDFFDNFQVADPPPQTEAQFELASFDMPTSLGTQDITVPALSGIAVKGVLFSWVNDDPAADADVLWGLGAATAPGTGNQWAWCLEAQDGASGTSLGGWDETKCITILDTSPPPNATLAEAEFTTFIDGGVRINWTKVTTVPPDRKIIATFFAGPEVQCKALVHIGTPDPLDLTTIGFQPDGVIGANGKTSDVTGVANFAGSYGWQDFQGPPENRLAWTPLENRALPSNAQSRRLSAQEGANLELATLGPTVRYEDPDLSGMTARFDNGATGELFGVFAFRVPGKTVRAGNIDAPVNGGTWVVNDPDFEPDLVMLMLTDLEVLDTTVTADINFGLGLFTDTDQFSLFATLEDDSNTHVAKSAVELDRAAFLEDFVNGVVLFDGKFVTMHSLGWTLAMSKVTNPPKQWGYLAIGDAAAAVADADDGCTPNPWTTGEEQEVTDE